mmetsp:Transcript_119670/g.223677  ORF Transcript_119670/g.223677 Transcript_119670/m.223677 type:complete len:324 (+) Transcript_119670:78-1049(+)
MQMATRFFVMSALVAGVASVMLRATQRAGVSSSSAFASASSAWIAYTEMAVQERSFWLSELTSTESALLLLQEAATAPNQTAHAGKQTKNASAVAAVATAAPKTPVLKNTTAKTPAHKDASAKQDMKNMDPAQLMKSLGIPSMKLSGKAALAPMLAMLKGLYDDSKERIAQQNVREEKSKKWFANKEVEHKNKLAKIEAKHKNHTLSDEFYTNETRDENHYFSYWARCRERQHRQFHTNLKIQHSMMQKVKVMIDMYEKTISGTADADKIKRQLQVVSGGVPEVVLIEVQQFCHDALSEVRASRQEIDAWAREDGMATAKMHP